MKPFVQPVIRAVVTVCLFLAGLEQPIGGAVAPKVFFPTISLFAPNGGPPGTLVTIQGVNLNGVSEVRFGGANAVFVPISPTALIATVPFDAVTGPISISTSLGSVSTVAVFVVGPRITRFSPSNASPGMVVIIEGANFGRALSVSFGGVNSSDFRVTAETQLHAVVPSGAVSGPIRITTPAGSALSERNLIVTGTEPLIEEFYPTNGVPGSVVTIIGRNFQSATAVKFAGTNAAEFSLIGPTQISAVVPSKALSGLISVVGPGGTGVSSQRFVVATSPVIIGFEPASGPPGTSVVIEGLNFGDATKVLFNGAVASFSIPSPTQIHAEVPGTGTAGPIQVVSPSGTGESDLPFSVTRTPVISEFMPLSGSPGTWITISGINFEEVVEVAFGARSANFSLVAGTQIIAAVPEGAETSPIRITNAYGTGASLSDFLVTAGLPAIDTFSPRFGSAGTVVQIEGDDFTGATSVRFNGIAASFQVTAPTQLFATVPAGATTGKISISTQVGTTRSETAFYVSPGIARFSPTEGIAGSSVVINGVNFDDAVSVRFAGVEASFGVDSPDKITAVVPEDAAAGSISVVTPGGIVASLNVFRPLPHITGFSPAAGPVGEKVTIEGTHMANAVTVLFGNVKASFTVVSATRILSTVPLGAVTGAIQVITPLGASISASEYIVGRGLVLAIERQDGAITVSWPSNTGGFRLERSGTLSAGSWAVVTNSPVVMGATSSLVFLPAQGNAFFRLAKP